MAAAAAALRLVAMPPAFTEIVVGVDGREGGEDAIALARQLGIDARLTLVTAVTAPRELLVPDAVAGYAGEVVPRAVLVKPPGPALHAVATEIGAGLIVIGSTRRGRLGRVMIGDDCRATLHGAPCAVAIAPHGHAGRPHEIRRILVGIDGGPESRAALATAVALATRTGAHLHLATVTTAADPASAAVLYGVDWSEIAERSRAAADRLLAGALAEIPGADGEVVEGRADLQLEKLGEDADLIVIGSRTRGALHQLLLGSTADHLAHHAPAPVVLQPLLSPAGA